MKRFNFQYQAAFPHPAAAAQQSPPSWVDAAVIVQGRRARHTSTSKRHLNSMKPTLNEVHESWEHHQHLSNAGPDQCTPAFERMPEASHTFRDFYILFINVTSVKPGWIFVASSYPQGRALHKHPAQFLSLAVFLSSLHRLQQVACFLHREADLHIFFHIKSYQTWIQQKTSNFKAAWC